MPALRDPLAEGFAVAVDLAAVVVAAAALEPGVAAALAAGQAAGDWLVVEACLGSAAVPEPAEVDLEAVGRLVSAAPAAALDLAVVVVAAAGHVVVELAGPVELGAAVPVVAPLVAAQRRRRDSVVPERRLLSTAVASVAVGSAGLVQSQLG